MKAYRVFGGQSSGKHPSEQVEMATFFNRLRREYPTTWGALAIHPRNEGLRSHQQMVKIKAEGGFVKGAVDVIIPGSPAFVMEMKSMSKTSRLSSDQIEYLTAAQDAGCFACVAFGVDAAWEALHTWLQRHG